MGTHLLPPIATLLFLATACGNAPAQDDRATTTTAALAGAVPSETLLLASARVGLPPEGVTPEALPAAGSQAAGQMVRYCTACHALPTPAMHAAVDWPVVARRMWLRMENLDPAFGVPVPDLATRLTMLQYLTENAMQVSRRPLPEGPGRMAFERTCSRCHDLPDPAQHAAGDWYVVARRMDQHMQQVLGAGLRADTLELIVRFLGEASTF